MLSGQMKLIILYQGDYEGTIFGVYGGVANSAVSVRSCGEKYFLRIG